MAQCHRLWSLALLSLAWPAARGILTTAQQPYQLMTDWRLSPVVGVESRAPLLQWAAPICANATVLSADVQVFEAATGVIMWNATALPMGQGMQTTYNASGGATALQAALEYAWRVRLLSSGSACEQTDWSPNATFVTAFWDNALSAVPVWHANASRQFVFLRRAFALASTASITAAYVVATGNPHNSTAGESENAKLLASYRVYLNGQWLGVGPGRPGRCGPLCPIQHDPMACSCEPEHVYDQYDVTQALLGASCSTAAPSCLLAVAAYNNVPGGVPGSGAESKVLVQLRIRFADGVVQDVGTANDWLAFAADAYMNGTCCTETAWYTLNKENYVAALEPVGWRSPSFNASAPAWTSVVTLGAFAAPLVARPTLPIRIADGLQPPVLVPVSPTHYFIDLGREIQGGLRVTFLNATSGARVALRLGEEVVYGGGCSAARQRGAADAPQRAAAPGATPPVPSVLYHMRTGNDYEHVWTLRDGPQTLELHEYLEFRYAELVSLDVDAGAQCVNSAVGDYSTPLTLACVNASQVITGVQFASYGTPTGCCTPAAGAPYENTFVVNSSCHLTNSSLIVAALCVGHPTCTIIPEDVFAGVDPCHGTFKWLDAAVTCGSAATSQQRAAAPALPFSAPQVEAWQLTYPAAYVSQQVSLPDAALTNVWNMCQYTVVAAGGLDMYVDSNTRQRSVICAEAMSINILMQYATSVEFALQTYTLEYMLNSRPSNLGWAEWQALAIMSTYYVWQHSGDLSLFVRHYAQLRNFTELALVNATLSLWQCVGNDFACSKPEIDWPAGMRDGFVFEPVDTVVNAYVQHAMDLFAQMAAAAGGHDADVALFSNASAAVRAAVNARLYNASCGCYVDGLGTQHTAWHSSVYSLALGVPTTPAQSRAVFDFVLAHSAGDTALCTPGNVFPAQSALDAFYAMDDDHGFAAYAMLTCGGLNSWLAMLAQGATTTMEAWNPDEKPNLTWSHSWAASPADAIPRGLFGVRPLVPGFAAVLVKPQPGPLLSGSATVPTIRGPVVVAFNQTLNGRVATAFAVAVTIPGATAGTVCVPASACGGGSLVVDGVTIPGVTMSDYLCANVSAGAHVVSGAPAAQHRVA